MTCFRATLPCSRNAAETVARMEEPLPGFEPPPVIVAEEDGAGWALILYSDGPPAPALLAAFAALVPGETPLVEALPDEDWVLLSQAGLQPVDAGPFHVHTGDHAGLARPGQVAIRIDASLAFGTGQHATTRGCLSMLWRLRRTGRLGRVLDLGTGSGILAIAARRVDPRSRVTASDVDRTAIGIAALNARRNRAPGIRFAVCPGHQAPAIRGGAPYDLVLANILASPLVALAEGNSWMVRPGGRLVLAGLLKGQERAVLAAHVARGFRLEARLSGEWPVLLLVRRGAPRRTSRMAAVRASRRGTGAARSGAGTI
jgi:ribosomal protein L11 methyltransferase